MRRFVELLMILVVTKVSNCVNKENILIELLNTTTAEERTAIEKAVDNIKFKYISNVSYFTLQIRNSSQQSNLYKYSLSLARKSDAIVLLDFNALPYSACIISSVTKIPLIRFHGSKSCKKREKCNSIVMSADYISYAQASIQILDAFHWKKIALMVDSHRFHEAAFFESLTANKGYTLTYIEIENEENHAKKDIYEYPCDRAMKQLAASSADVILLYARGGSSLLLLEGCNPMKNYVWIIQDLISEDVTRARDSHMVIGFGLTANNGTKWNSKKTLYALAYDSILLIAMTLKSIRSDGLWVAGNISSNRETFYRYAKQMNINGLTSTIQFDANGHRVVKELRILNLNNNTFIEVGKWIKSGNILKLTDRIHFNDASLDGAMLKGRQLSVVTVLAEPFVMRTLTADGSYTYHGFCIDILKKLATDLKFTYKIKLVEDGFYGALINGEWNGMIREVIDGKAEMIVAPLTRTVKRQKYVAMTASFMYYTDKLMMKKTIIEEREFFQFMSPYSINVWLVMAALIAAVALFTYILNYFSPYGYKNEESNKTSEEFNLFNSLWFAIACMLQQGADHAPKAISGRILAGFFWFFIVVSISTYTANLVAFFTVETFHKPVTNFKEAVDSSYDLGVVEKSNLYTLFLSSEYDLYKRAWSRMKRIPKNFSQAIEWMRTGRPYIHILDGPALDYFAQKQPCDLFAFPGLQSPRSYVFALHQNDPHVQEISLAILHLRETGFMEKLRQKYWDSSRECPDINTNRLKKKTIQLDSMAGVFIVLGVGFLISFLTLAIEIYWYRAGKQRTRSLKEKTRNILAEKRSQRVVIGKKNPALQRDSLSATNMPFSGWTT